MEKNKLTLPTLPNLESLCVRKVEREKHFRLSGANRPLLYITDIDTSNTLKKLEIDSRCCQRPNILSLFSRLATHNTIEKLRIASIEWFTDDLITHLCALKTLKIGL